jgi:hypothetical protein
MRSRSFRHVTLNTFFKLDDLLFMAEKPVFTHGHQLAFLDELVILQESQGSEAVQLITKHTALKTMHFPIKAQH